MGNSRIFDYMVTYFLQIQKVIESVDENSIVEFFICYIEKMNCVNFEAHKLTVVSMMRDVELRNHESRHLGCM